MTQKRTEVQTIQCPKCGTAIPLTDALTRQIEESIKHDFDLQLQKKDDELQTALQAKEAEHEQKLKTERSRIAREAEKKAQESAKADLEAAQTELAEKSKLLKEAKGREIELARRQREVEEKEQALTLEVDKKVQAEKQKIIDNTLKNHELELRDLKAEIAEKNQKLQQANKNELDLRKRTRELEEREKTVDLEVQRKMDEERQKIGTAVKATVEEEYRLKLREKEVKIESMNKQIDELKRKGEQGSVQSQGEAQEVELDEALQSTFRYDEITRVAKGKEGADVLQEVHNSAGRPCGSILFESKRTKNWSEGWIEKAKGDRLDAKADVVVIVTHTMPKDICHIGLREGVWVCDLQSSLGLATALREGIIKLSEANNALAGKTEKMELVYKYLCSPEFEQRIQAIVDAFTSMRAGLEREKTAMNKIWAQREKEIGKVLANTAGMYGDLKGIIGRSLPEVKALELPAGDEKQLVGGTAALNVLDSFPGT